MRRQWLKWKYQTADLNFVNYFTFANILTRDQIQTLQFLSTPNVTDQLAALKWNTVNLTDVNRTLNPNFQFNTKQKSNLFLFLNTRGLDLFVCQEDTGIFPFTKPENPSKERTTWKCRKAHFCRRQKWNTGSVALYKRLPFPPFKNTEGTRDSRLHPAKHPSADLLSHAGGPPGIGNREASLSEAQQSSFTAWASAHHCHT